MSEPFDLASEHADLLARHGKLQEVLRMHRIDLDEVLVAMSKGKYEVATKLLSQTLRRI